ncbi:hypothetical protein Glove_70g69 [Diversispora epigaea]|uniref:Uncharacterized protein n=1 Tax=Diversispora epigaea TaxID=1348612 RepID=A0A397JKY6_9GLOM|nr:hypothetical protein Glove_70g69 [Diversispora epigaea]
MQKYMRINGPGCLAIFKPPMKRKIMPQKHEDQFEWFMSSKENINLSSYKIHTKTELPLKYLSNQKETLWEKFHKSFPNGMKRTAFLNRLRNGSFVYQENLGGLCSTCSTYRYDVFEDLSNLIIQNITDREFQEFNVLCPKTHDSLVSILLIEGTKNFKRFLKRDYPKHLHIMHDGKVVHDSCINHCLPFAFGNCNEAYISECELQEMLEYYLAHLTRKGYLNNQFNANLLQLDNNIYSKNQENKELEIQVFDYWSNDNKQDT